MSFNLLPPVLWEAVPFGDKEAFLDFQLPHYLTHVALAKATHTQIATLDELRSDTFPHAQVHRDLAVALGLQDSFDFAAYDLTDRNSFYNFMLSHSVVHKELQQLAGL